VVYFQTANVDSLVSSSNIAGNNISATENITANNIVANNIIRTQPITFSSLPAAATIGTGARAFITDANLAAATNFAAQIAGGGSNNVPVYSDGANWRIG
jgi:hypothetical protein